MIVEASDQMRGVVYVAIQEELLSTAILHEGQGKPQDKFYHPGFGDELLIKFGGVEEVFLLAVDEVAERIHDGEW